MTMTMSMPKVLQEMIQDFARPVTRCDWRTCKLTLANRLTTRCLMIILHDFIVEQDKDRLTRERVHITKFIEENKDRYVFYGNRYIELYGHPWFDLLDKVFHV